MKTKIFIFVVFLFLLFYLYLSHLNSENVKLFIGAGKFYETSLANFVVISFVIGVLFSMFINVLLDFRRWVSGLREERRRKREEELNELISKAQSLISLGENEKAVEVLEKAMKRNPERKEPYLKLIDLFLSISETRKALDTGNIAKTNVGKDEEILLKMAKVYLFMKDYGNFEAELKDVLRINELNLKALLGLRNLYIWRKDWANAFEVQKKIKRVIKAPEEEKILLGIKYEKAKEIMESKNETEEVIKELKEIIEEDKRFIPAYISLAEVYMRKGKGNEAARVYGRGYTRTGHIIFLLKMEDLYIGRGDPAVILKIYRRLLELSPRDHILSLLYGRLCLRLEMIDEALNIFENLSGEIPFYPGLRKAIAEAYIHRGEVAKAIEELKKIFPERSYDLPFACFHCGAKKEKWEAFCEDCGRWNTINIKKDLKVSEPFFLKDYLREEEEIGRWFDFKE